MQQPRQYKKVRFRINQPTPKVPSGDFLGWTESFDRDSLYLHIAAKKRVRVRKVDKKKPKR